ncbi:MAG: hypothetical protein NT154_04350, partial [Verrucomicrobia bacterium]|nr:hypothetical protein [Verrucomicrobiota bacterium]
MDAVYQSTSDKWLLSLGNVVQTVHEHAGTPGNVRILDNGDGSVTVFFSGEPSVEYVVQATTTINPANWVNISTNTADDTGLWHIVDPMGNRTQRYYRSVLP